MHHIFLLRILLTLLTFYGCVSLSGQPYLNNTSAWHEFFHYPNGSGSIYEDYTISIRGDTVINGISYFKTWKSGIATVNPGGYMSPIDKPLRPIREEEKRFYYFDIANNQERLLSDFNLTIGDMIDLPEYCDGHVISWADTVYIGTTPRLRYHLNGLNDIVQIIEGVGTTFGLFWSPCNSYIPCELQCYSQDGAYLQLNPGVNCSAFVVATKDISSELMTLSPNPCHDLIEIRLPSSLSQPLTISVFDLLGNRVHDAHLAFPSPVESIDMGNTPPGLYIVCLQYAGSISCYKVLRL
jgi:hypothetical protein